MAAKMFEKHQKYHKTYILHIVFLIIAIVYNVFVMFIVSVNGKSYPFVLQVACSSSANRAMPL